jgi:methylated-DNA-[protein]-cysteine S-methyltransferase
VKNLFYYEFPTGKLGITEDGKGLSGVFFCNEKKPDDFSISETPLIKKTAMQLYEYFDGKRKTFDLPLSLKGTDFQMAVWEALRSIPFGLTSSYKDVAAKAGNPKACRAVGSAANKNPIVIIIPCHRMLGQDGSLTGYAGGLSMKEFLLKLEKSNS